MSKDFLYQSCAVISFSVTAVMLLINVIALKKINFTLEKWATVTLLTYFLSSLFRSI